MRANWKMKRFDDYKHAIKKIQSHGITVNGCFIIGLDTHGTEVFEQIFEFVKDSGLYEVQITMLTAFPGTKLYQRLQKSGRLLKENDWKRCTLFDINFHPDKMKVSELIANFKTLSQKIYNDEFTVIPCDCIFFIACL